jgi:hypothetical protein
MGKSVSTLQPSIKKGKASGLRKLIRETQSSDKDEDSGPFTAAVATDPTRPWRVDFMNYLNTTEVKLPPEMTIIQWWGVCIIVIFMFHITYLSLCKRLMRGAMDLSGLH